MSERFCVTCKHHRSPAAHECVHPTLTEVDMVTGIRQPVMCARQRSVETSQQIVYGMHMGRARCGQAGLYWEAKDE